MHSYIVITEGYCGDVPGREDISSAAECRAFVESLGGNLPASSSDFSQSWNTAPTACYSYGTSIKNSVWYWNDDTAYPDYQMNCKGEALGYYGGSAIDDSFVKGCACRQTFAEVNSGRCTDYEMSNLDETECEAYQDNNYPATWGGSGKSKILPNGCYRYGSSQVTYKYNPDTTLTDDTKCTTSNHCVCQMTTPVNYITISSVNCDTSYSVMSEAECKSFVASIQGPLPITTVDRSSEPRGCLLRVGSGGITGAKYNTHSTSTAACSATEQCACNLLDTPYSSDDYQSITTGQCVEALTKQECALYAAANGLGFLAGSQSSSSAPNGCINTGAGLQFNTGKSASNTCQSFTCVCKRLFHPVSYVSGTQHVTVSSGLCTELSDSSWMTQSECSAYSSSRTSTGFVTETTSNFPKNCIYNALADSARWNSESSSTKSCGTSNMNCICKISLSNPFYAQKIYDGACNDVTDRSSLTSTQCSAWVGAVQTEPRNDDWSAYFNECIMVQSKWVHGTTGNPTYSCSPAQPCACQLAAAPADGSIVQISSGKCDDVTNLVTSTVTACAAYATADPDSDSTGTTPAPTTSPHGCFLYADTHWRFNSATNSVACTEDMPCACTVTDAVSCDAGEYADSNDQCVDCGTGQYNSQVGQTSCKSCSAGQYASSDTATDCSACQAGMFQELAAATEHRCKSCAKGTKFDSVTTVCLSCPTGKYQDQDDATNAMCQTCDPGQYAVSVLVACTNCETGKYQEAAEASGYECKFCEAGQYAVDATVVCKNCETGKYQEANQAAAYSCKFCLEGKATATSNPTTMVCTACVGGQYQNQNDAAPAACKTCVAGQYAVNPTVVCKNCETGKYQEAVQAAAYSCKFCPKGTATAATNPTTSVCTNCVGGQYQNQNDAAPVVCQTCGSGQYAVSATVACKNCETGKYQELASANEYKCKFCAPGQASTALNQICSPCNQGKYQDQANAAPAVCKTCGKGKYAPDATQDCDDCTAPLYQDLDQATEYTCKSCVAGRTFDSISKPCEGCEAGKTKPSGTSSCTDCSKGQFAPDAESPCGACPSGKFQELDASIEYKCKVCASGTKFVDTQSACDDCVAGKYQNQNTIDDAKCKSCAAGQFAASRQTTCQPCEEGKFQELEAATDYECKFCDVGKLFTAVSTACDDCDTGKFQESSSQGSAACNFCSAGKKFTDKTTACADCDSGKYQQENAKASATCKYCAAGFAFDTMSTVCVECVNGRYQDQSTAASVTCLACSAGQFTSSNVIACSDCVAGKFQESTEATEYGCKFCAAGKQFTDNTALCMDCVGGKYQAENAGAWVNCTGCVSGKHSAAETASVTCLDCPQGYHGTGVLSFSKLTACVICEKGRFANVTGLASCVGCSAGKVLQQTGATNGTQCENCAAGSYNPYVGHNEGCYPCPLSSAGASECAGCAPGKYKPSAAEDNCPECPEGWYSDDRDVSMCKQCPIGYYSNDQESIDGNIRLTRCQGCPRGRFGKKVALIDNEGCEACPVGRYSDQEGYGFVARFDEIPCSACSAGRYSDQAGNTKDSNCKDCASGRYSSKTAATYESDCEACPKGKFSTAVGVSDLTRCKNCPAGFEQTSPGVAYCLPCGAGKYKTNMGFHDCSSCQSGQYRSGDMRPRTSCTACPAGFSQGKDGQGSCTACNVGTFATNEEQANCAPCSSNTFAGSVNSSTCIACPLGFVAPVAGASSCERCAAGMYWSGVGSCDACPGGWYRSSKDRLDRCLACDPGQYQSDSEQVLCFDCVPGKYQPQSNMTECLDCGVNMYQDASASTSCKSCQASFSTSGEKGKTLCSQCQAGRAGANCADCPKGWYSGNEDESCEQCLPGKHAAAPGSPFCLSCPAGKFQQDAGAALCSDCAEGKYQDEPRQEQCKVCKEGYVPNTKLTACEKPPYMTVADCKDREYLDDSSTNNMDHSCQRCPLGADCQVGEEFPKQKLSTLKPLCPDRLQQDWWNITWVDYSRPEFSKCPYKNRCLVTGCTNISSGPLCAVCARGFFRSTTGECIECTEDTVPIKIGVLSGLLTLLILLVWSQRKRIQRLRAKYGPAWRDIVRILTINLSYCQVSSSLPSVIQISWPSKYLELLDTLSFVNIDVVSLLGMKCVGGDFWDFRGRLLLACSVPPAVLLASIVVFQCRSSHVKARAKHGTSSMKEMTMHSVEYVWDMFDLNASGEIDEEEFHNLLVHLNHEATEHTHPNNTEMRRQMMRDLRAVKIHHPHHRHKHKLVVLRPHFVELVASGKMGSALRDDWILWAEHQRIREHFLSDMLLVLFLLHAPLSQRGFYFFDCREVGGRSFLQADFSIECFTEKHETFMPVALGFLVFFSFLFPLLVLLQLCRHRKRLHTPEIRHKFGFLYASFNVGGEYWEIHEVFRKMILTGLLIFIPSNARASVAILVSVMTVASLNYVKPHKNIIVFWVAQGSFLMTTFKYLSVILLMSNVSDVANTETRTQKVVGMILITLDVVFMAISFCTMFAVVIVLRSVLSANERRELISGTKVVPGGEEFLELQPTSKWHAFDATRAVEHAKVEQTEIETQRAHDAAIAIVEEHGRVAHTRLMGRVKKRKTMIEAGIEIEKMAALASAPAAAATETKH